MAENVVLGIDVQDNSERALKTFSDNMRSANKEVAVAAESFRKAGQGAKNFGDAVRAPSKSVGEFGKGLKEVAEGVNELNQAWRDVVGPAANAAGTSLFLGKAYRNLDKSQRQAVKSALSWKNALKQSDRAAIALYNSASVLDKAIAGVNKSKVALNKTLKVATNSANILLGVYVAMGKASLDLANSTAKFSQELRDQSMFLEVSQGALAGQVLAYEAIGLSQEDAIQTYAKLNDLVSGALSGNEDYIEILNQIGIAQKNIKDVKLDEVFTRYKKSVDRGNLSYRDSAEILGQKLTKAIDDVRDNQQAISVDSVEASARFRDSWEENFSWWNSVKLEAKELKFNLGAAFGDLFDFSTDPILRPNQTKPYVPPDDLSADPFSVGGREGQDLR